jgi:L,D-peptidoglycan transpeptidase YkuD (ErfK/YbiS/YcfS/YnhG family)
MGKGKKRKILILLLALLAVISLMSFVFVRMVPEPPLAEVNYAQQKLAEAREKKADVYATNTFKRASMLYDSAMISWKQENMRFILSRDYSATVRYAALSAQKSEEALHQGLSSSAGMRQTSQNLIGRLNTLLLDFNGVFSRFPLPQQLRSSVAKGKLALSEAQHSFNNSQYAVAERKLKAANELLSTSHQRATALITEYFQSHSQWVQWVDETIAESAKRKTTVVIVDKIAGKCYVYKNGKLSVTFEAELGKNWVGDKRHRGDHATPEGRYKVTQKKEGRNTIFHKALLINYPNEDDKKRFQAEIENGSIPRNMHIGNLIEIHGHGGKGADWTEGCVALTNSEMDKLYAMVSVGTPVTIVGSIAGLNEIMKNTRNE